MIKTEAPSFGINNYAFVIKVPDSSKRYIKADFTIDNNFFSLKKTPQPVEISEYKLKPSFFSKIRKVAKDSVIPLAAAEMASAFLFPVSIPIIQNVNSESQSIQYEKTAVVSASEVQTFSDVSPSNPYYKAIQQIADKGIIDGFENGTFRPNDPVTRAQFAKMIDLTFNLYPNEQDWSDLNPPFIDLGPDDQNNLYHEYVAKAYEKHITEGIKPGEFGPQKQITRAQVITMVTRAANNLTPEKLKQPPLLYRSSLGNFSDIHAEFAKWFQYNCLSTDIVEYGQNWNPWLNATRGEVTQILYNLLNHNGETEKLEQYPIIINGATELQKATIVDTIQSCRLDYNILLKTYGGITVTIKDLSPWGGAYLGNGKIELDDSGSIADLREETAHEIGHMWWELLLPDRWAEWNQLVGNGSSEWPYIPIEHFAELFRLNFNDPAHGGNLPIKTRLKFITPEEMRKWVIEGLPSELLLN